MSKDAQAILILCSNLCVGEGIKPLKPSEWKMLARTLVEKEMVPGDLLDMSKDEITKALECDDEFAERIVDLVGRSASLFFEVSKYENMGISLVTRADKAYPVRLKNKLGESCPPYFFYAGDLKLLKKRSIGFVGSRDMMAGDIDFETKLVKETVRRRYAIVSGGARGADMISEEVALSSGGRVIEFLADSMIRKLRKSEVVKAVQKGKLLLLSVVNPDAGFNVGNAMNRNKYIYAQADAVVAIKSIKQGGTWSGVKENLKNKYCPEYCWNNAKYSDNLALIKEGAIGIDEEWSVKDLMTDEEFRSRFETKEKLEDNDVKQMTLFS